MSEHYLDDVDYLLKQERKRTGAAFSESDQAGVIHWRPKSIGGFTVRQALPRCWWMPSMNMIVITRLP